MTDEKVSPFVTRPQTAKVVEGTEEQNKPAICPYCTQPITTIMIKFDPLPNGVYLTYFKCPMCHKVINYQLATHETLFGKSTIATPQPRGPIGL